MTGVQTVALPIWRDSVNRIIEETPTALHIGITSLQDSHLADKAIRDIHEAWFGPEELQSFFTMRTAMEYGNFRRLDYYSADIYMANKAAKLSLEEKNNTNPELKDAYHRAVKASKRSIIMPSEVKELFHRIIGKENPVKFVVISSSEKNYERDKQTIAKWMNKSPLLHFYVNRGAKGSEQVTAFTEDNANCYFRFLITTLDKIIDAKLENATGCIVFASTQCPARYYQQLGVCLGACRNPSCKPAFIDLVDNRHAAKYRSLYSNIPVIEIGSAHV